MKNYNIIIIAIAVILCVFGMSSANLSAIGASAKNKTPISTAQKQTTSQPVQKAKTETKTYVDVDPLALVKNPDVYLNKRVKIIAQFDKFSSLGLDYKPALRTSDKYITFLIKRNDVKNDIPLSELKNFMKREVAEKHIDLETNDVIEYSGLVFSDALGDAWLEVENFKIISSKAKSNENKTK